MTTAEACTLVVDLTRELAAVRAEAASYRLLAVTAIAHAGELTREIEMIDRRRYVHQQRTAEQRPAAMQRRQQEAA